MWNLWETLLLQLAQSHFVLGFTVRTSIMQSLLVFNVKIKDQVEL